LATDTADLDDLRIAVFSIALVSSFVESLFSKMDYNQSKIRNRLGSGMMSAILHIHDEVLGDPMKPLSSNMELKTTAVVMVEKEAMMKHVGKIVCKLWNGRRYHGRIVDVTFHEVYARWMYVVHYTDGDREDYWRSELQLVLCRCENVHHDELI
jgi:hypothetical protein